MVVDRAEHDLAPRRERSQPLAEALPTMPVPSGEKISVVMITPLIYLLAFAGLDDGSVGASWAAEAFASPMASNSPASEIALTYLAGF